MTWKGKSVIAGVLVVAGSILNVLFSFAVHSMLKGERLSLFPIDACLNGLAENSKQQQLYFIFEGLLILLAVLVAATSSKSYTAKLFTVTPTIKIPMRAGQGQDGTAWFMSDKEKKNEFLQLELNPLNAVANEMIKTVKT